MKNMTQKISKERSKSPGESLLEWCREFRKKSIEECNARGCKLAKLKRINLGKKEISTRVTEPKGSNIYYPSFYISDKKLPIEPEDVGKLLTATVRLKVTGVNMRTNENKQSLNYDFEVREIVFGNKGTI